MILGVFDDLLERPPRQKLAALLVLVAAVGFLDWTYFYGPRQGDLAELHQQAAQRRTELDGKKAKTDARASAEKELRDLGAELKRAQARLPDQREIADLLSSVAASGRGAGLEITLFRQKPEVLHDFYAEVPVEMQMRGTYHDVALFLDSVKRLDRIVNVSNITLAKPRVAGDVVALDASCIATTFRFLDEAERQKLELQRKNEAKKAGKSA
jgi:type IV pilus assembly protein PilO